MKAFLTVFIALVVTARLVGNDIYSSVKELPFDPAGYFATEFPLDELFRSKEIKTVIELGCWAGASTRFFGYRVGEGGKVYAVDHWNGTPSHIGELNDPRLDHIYHLFLSNIYHAGLADRVVPIRMTTNEAAKALDVKADLIYIDASRSENGVYQDIMNWQSHLNPGGVMCGAEYREPEVRKGVGKAAKELGREVYTTKKGFFWGFK